MGGGGGSIQHDLLSTEGRERKKALSHKNRKLEGRGFLAASETSILWRRRASLLKIKGGLTQRGSPDTPASRSED